MRRKLYAVLLWLGSTTLPESAKSQFINDFESWHNIGVSYVASPDLSVAAKYIVGNRLNLTEFSRSAFSLQVDKDVNKWLRVGTEYRYTTSYEEDFNRFWLYAVADKKIFRKTHLQWRTLFQTDIARFNQDYLREFRPHLVTRNMLRLKYKYNKKTRLYGYADIYHTWKNNRTRAYRMRYGVGSSYLYKKRHDLGMELVWINEFNRRSEWDVAFANLKYVYIIKAKRKKEYKPNMVY